MIAYHVDRSAMLVPNQTINLFNNIKLDDIFTEYNNSFSNHGLQYLNQYSDSSVWELCLEFVRLKNFPHLPSRLQALFGVKTLEEALVWKGYISSQTNSKINICKIEFSDCYEFDARWMTNPPLLNNQNNNYNFNQKSIAKMLEYSYKYWSKEFSSNPLPELLIVSPIKILEII